jgi:hypothetical protein
MICYNCRFDTVSGLTRLPKHFSNRTTWRDAWREFAYVPNDNHFIAASGSNLHCNCDNDADVNDHNLPFGPGQNAALLSEAGSFGCAEPTCNGCYQPTTRLAGWS